MGHEAYKTSLVGGSQEAEGPLVGTRIPLNLSERIRKQKLPNLADPEPWKHLPPRIQ
jgi:hypothetical protein